MKLALATLFIFLSQLCIAAPPTTNITLSSNKSSSPLNTPPTHSITLRVPGTLTSLRFSTYTTLLSQTEASLCIVEALADIFATVVRNQEDGFLRLNHYVQSYGAVILMMDDWAPPARRLTYGIVVSALRGIALFYSLYGYFGVDIDIMDGKWGMVGTGKVGGGRALPGA